MLGEEIGISLPRHNASKITFFEIITGFFKHIFVKTWFALFRFSIFWFSFLREFSTSMALKSLYCCKICLCCCRICWLLFSPGVWSFFWGRLLEHARDNFLKLLVNFNPIEISEAYLEPSQTSEMETFAKIVNEWKPIDYFRITLHLWYMFNWVLKMTLSHAPDNNCYVSDKYFPYFCQPFQWKSFLSHTPITYQLEAHSWVCDNLWQLKAFLKMIKNDFYFMLKALFVVKIFKFFLNFLMI